MLIFQSLNNESSGRVQHAKPRHPQVKEMMISTAKYHGSLLHSAIESGRSAVFGAVLTAVKSRLSPEEVLFSPQPRVLTGCCGHQSDPRRCLLWRRSMPPQDVFCACPMCALLFCVQHRRSDHTAVLRRLPTLSSPHRCFTVGCRCPPSPVSSAQGLWGSEGSARSIMSLIRCRQDVGHAAHWPRRLASLCTPCVDAERFLLYLSSPSRLMALCRPVPPGSTDVGDVNDDTRDHPPLGGRERGNGGLRGRPGSREGKPDPGKGQQLPFNV